MLVSNVLFLFNETDKNTAQPESYYTNHILLYSFNECTLCLRENTQN